MAKAPKLKLNDISVEDSKYNNGNGQIWDARTLIEAAKDEPVFKLPIAHIDIDLMPFVTENIRDFAQHVKRAAQTDLKYPVIMDDLGFIIDGWHRVVKALVIGQEEILCQRLMKMPEPDETYETYMPK